MFSPISTTTYKGKQVYMIMEELIVCFDRTEVDLYGFKVIFDTDKEYMIIHPSSYDTLRSKLGRLGDYMMENWVFDENDDIILNQWDLDPDGDFDFQQFAPKFEISDLEIGGEYLINGGGNHHGRGKQRIIIHTITKAGNIYGEKYSLTTGQCIGQKCKVALEDIVELYGETYRGKN